MSGGICFSDRLNGLVGCGGCLGCEGDGIRDSPVPQMLVGRMRIRNVRTSRETIRFAREKDGTSS